MLKEPTNSNSEIGQDKTKVWWFEYLTKTINTDQRATYAVLIMGLLMLIPRLGSMGLWDPWETHYGEVAREMLWRDDYIYPHWESSYFFSKPPLAMWLMALGLILTGAESNPLGQPLGSWTEWGMRLPFAFIAIATMWAVYRIGCQLKDRYTGLIAALVLGTSAQFIFIAKQTMVDMPLVGCLTIGLALFCAAVFDEKKDSKGTVVERATAGTGVLLASVSQLLLICREQTDTSAILACYLGITIAIGYAVYLYGYASRQTCYLSGFYVLAGLGALAKGPAVVLVLAFIGLYYVLSQDWKMLLRAKLWFGIPLTILIAAPWFIALTLFDGRNGEGKTFYGRFWLHDTFNRFGKGVHGERPTFVYYIQQLGYGMFPWAALIPAALGFAVKDRDRSADDESIHRRRLMLFVIVWAFWAFVSFTTSRTGFHHYIFPALPPIAILVGYWIRHLIDSPSMLGGWFCIPILVLLVVIGLDLIHDPQHLSSLFTYQYTRTYPSEIKVETIKLINVFLALLIIGLVATFIIKQKADSILVFVVAAVFFGAWISHYHFNMLAQHWSQAHMFETYYQEKRANEPIYAYQLNWRGETFYSRNTIIQVKQANANRRMAQLVDRPGREFIVVEQSRFHTLKSILSADKRDKLRIIDKSSIKFYLCVVDE